MLSERSVDVIQQRLKLLYDDHVSELLGILNRNIESIKPDQQASVSDSIKNFNNDTRVSLLKHGDTVTSGLTSTLEKLEIATLTESEKNKLVEVVESYLNPDLYLKRFNIFLQSITRHMQRRGLAMDLRDYRVDMPRSICEASAKNLCRTILQKIRIELDILVEKGARAESREKRKSDMEIFLSYSWHNSNIADCLDILFKTKNITLKRDVRDVEYKQSIKEFMKKVRTSDYCLVVISENYLKSINCMYEVTEFIKDENYIDRILPLVQTATNIFNIDGKNKYIKFWQDKFIELERSSSDIDELNRIETINELKKIENIQRNIGDFLSIISDMKTIVFDNEIDVTGFNEIYSVINPNDSFLGEHYDVDGFFLLNVPRTLISKVFTWMAKESKGYTFELNNAKIFTKNEIDQKVKGDVFQAEWFCKKYAAIPINELAIKLGQNYIPYDHRFLEILRKHRNKIVGNTAIHLTKEEIEQYG